MEDRDLISQQEARNAVDAAHLAFKAVAKFDQEKIDRICAAMSQNALSESERLGAMAQEETGFGIAADKREKNRFAAEDVWNFFRDMKTVGVVRQTESIVEIASPRGVVAAIIPSTNPTSTAIFKIIIAVKSRNTIVLSPHPSAAKSIGETARIMREAGVREGLPPDAVCCLTNSTIEGTETLMKHKRTAVILATGGTGLVRAAYSSGKPAFGVGPGNVPVFIERTANIKKAVSDILTSTCFDNGTICASEQSVVVDAPVEPEVRREFAEQGGYFLNQAEAEAVGKILLTAQRTLNPKIVGKSAGYIANLAGVSIPGGVRCLLADCGGIGRDFPWSIEKLSPTLAFFVVDGAEAGAAKCEEILQFGGMGHTAGMHTQSREAAIDYGKRMPASRVIINSPTTHGAIGFSTDLAPSMTLGCGSWGGNVTSDNVSPIHLMDIKRVAFETRPVDSVKRSFPSREFIENKDFNKQNVQTSGIGPNKKNINRQEIASLVDRFLSNKLAQSSVEFEEKIEPMTENHIVEDQKPSVNPVKTIIHELKTENAKNGNTVKTVDFVSEEDVKKAIEKGEKIYTSAKTIITPSARDLGDEKEIFARV